MFWLGLVAVPAEKKTTAENTHTLVLRKKEKAPVGLVADAAESITRAHGERR